MGDFATLRPFWWHIIILTFPPLVCCLLKQILNDDKKHLWRWLWPNCNGTSLSYKLVAIGQYVCRFSQLWINKRLNSLRPFFPKSFWPEAAAGFQTYPLKKNLQEIRSGYAQRKSDSAVIERQWNSYISTYILLFHLCATGITILNSGVIMLNVEHGPRAV